MTASTEQHNGATLLIEAYAVLWVILMGWLVFQWRKQASLNTRLAGLEQAIEKAGTTDPKKVAETLRTLVFESSYGPAAFGGAETYGIAQQILIPVTIAQVKGGKIAEVARIKPSELEARLAKSQ